MTLFEVHFYLSQFQIFYSLHQQISTINFLLMNFEFQVFFLFGILNPHLHVMPT